MKLKAALKELRRLVIRMALRGVAVPVTVTSASALFIAPHPDDETFGCGGMIALKCRMGVKVAVAFLTDGEASHAECCKTPPEMIGRARRDVALEVCAGLGVHHEDIYWLGLPDGGIPHVNGIGFSEARLRLTELIDRLSPGQIFAPHPHDAWPDHEVASKLVFQSLRQSKNGAAAELIYYFVWVWHNLHLRVLPTVICDRLEWVDIKEVMSLKLKASSIYMERTMTECKIPIAGALPDGFTSYFAHEREIYARSKTMHHKGL